MSRSDFENYLAFVAVFAGVLGVVNLMRPHKRWLGIGSIFVGVAALVYRQTASPFATAIPGGLAVACMATDVAGRRRA